MKNRLSLLVAGAAILTALGAQASSNDPGETFEKKFFRHIGLPDRDGTEGGGVTVAIMEGHYNPQYQYSGKIVHTSPNMNPPLPTFEEVAAPSSAIVKEMLGFYRAQLINSHVGEKIVAQYKVPGIKAKTLGQLLDNPLIQALKSHSVEFAREVQYIVEDANLGVTLDSAGLGGCDVSHHNGSCLKRHYAWFYLSDNHDGLVEFSGELSSVVNTEGVNQFLKDTLEARQASTKYGNNVVETFFKIAPAARVHLYHSTDFVAAARDTKCKLVNFSCQRTTPISNCADLAAELKAFANTGKLVIMALDDCGQHCLSSERDAGILQMATQAHDSGFEVLVCSASSVGNDQISGTISNHIYTGNHQYQPHYMTAPGVNVQLLGNEPQFSCSLAAPCVTAAATILWSEYPNLNASQVKEALVNSGRKPDPLVGEAPDLEEIKAFLAAAGVNKLDEPDKHRLHKRYHQERKKLSDDCNQADLETLKRVLASPILSERVLGPEDAKKYKNHLDINRALEYAKAHFTTG